MIGRQADSIVLSGKDRFFSRRAGSQAQGAALDIATGAVIGKCYKRHRATEFLGFLKRLDAEMPEGPDIYLVMDNYTTHKMPKVKARLARRPYWDVHFTPTSRLGSIRSNAGLQS